MTLEEFNAILSQGAYAWPGGYPLYFVMADGGAMSFKAVEAEADRIRTEINEPSDKEWHPLGVEVNWEDPDLYCDHTNERIESAYAED